MAKYVLRGTIIGGLVGGFSAGVGLIILNADVVDVSLLLFAAGISVSVFAFFGAIGGVVAYFACGFDESLRKKQEVNN